MILYLYLNNASLNTLIQNSNFRKKEKNLGMSLGYLISVLTNAFLLQKFCYVLSYEIQSILVQ